MGTTKKHTQIMPCDNKLCIIDIPKLDAVMIEMHNCAYARNVVVPKFWSRLADDVREELRQQGICTLKDFCDDVVTSQKMAVVFHKPTASMVTMYWGDVEYDGEDKVVSIGNVINGDLAKQRPALIIRLARPTMNAFMDIAGASVCMVAVPSSMQRLCAFVEKAAKMEKIATDDIDGCVHNVYMKKKEEG